MGQTAAGTTGTYKSRRLPTPVLFNDVYFASFAPREGVTWPCFPNLPPELRQHIWLQYLQERRLIDIEIWHADDYLPSHPDYRYTTRNQLGRIVSGSRFGFALRGRGSYQNSLSPLLRVNREARDVARAFYHIRLPFPGRDQVLYLNSALDVVQVQPRFIPQSPTEPLELDDWQRMSGPVLDFLHDARAYDVKDQGIAHLMLREQIRICLLAFSITPLLRATAHTPAVIHPTAASSFACILRHTLRSLFLVMGSFESSRTQRSSYIVPQAQQRHHFAQTLPLEPCGHATATFRWLDVDPRPGAARDLETVSLIDDTSNHRRSWGWLEQAVGVTEADRAARAGADGGGFRVYTCVVQQWHFPADAEEDVWSRAALARRFRYDVDNWLDIPEAARDGASGPDARLREYGSTGLEEMGIGEGARMEMGVPRDAVGMWILPAGAFKRPEDHPHDVFDLFRVDSGTRPGLMLFEVS